MKANTTLPNILIFDADKTLEATHELLPRLFNEYVFSDEFAKMSQDRKREIIELYQWLCVSLDEVNETCRNQSLEPVEAEQKEILPGITGDEKLSWYFSR
jgi:hypothetical protein